MSRWPVSTGEMAERIRAFDWAATPLGPAEGWPPLLRSTVDMLLAHGFPMVALWGPDLIQIYNDGYRVIMADKHPAGLGQPTAECWPEVWHINAPIYARVRAGETVTYADALYPIARNGPVEDAWFTLTYSPLRDEGGAVAGVLVTVFETTERVLAERRRGDSEALLRIALEGGGMGAWRWDLDQRLIWGDAAFLALWGLPPSDAAQPLARFTERMSPASAAEMEAVVTRAIEAGEVFDGQLEIVAGPTAGRWVRWRGRADLGAPSMLHGTSFDSTAQRRTDESLRGSEERFRAYVTASSDVVYRMSPDWSEMRQLVGRSFLADTEEPSAGWLDRYIHPDDQAPVRAAIDRAIADKSMFELEHRVLRTDGSLGWTHSRAVLILADDGAISEWLGAASDVTAIHAAGELMQESESRQAFLLALSDALRPLGDAEDIRRTASFQLGRHLRANRVAYAEDAGDDEHFRVGDNYVDGIPAVVGRHRYADFGSDIPEELRAGRIRVQPDIQNDDRLTDAEKRSLAGVHVGASLNVPLVKDGVLVAFLGVNFINPHDFRPEEIALVVDVAERTWAAVERARAEAALRDSEERFSTLAQSIDDVFYLTDLDRGRLLYLSPSYQKIWGRPVAGLLADLPGFMDTIVPEDQPIVRAGQARQAAGQPVTSEYRIIRPDGEVRWILDRCFPVTPGPDGARRSAGNATDITVRKLADQALRESEERFAQFAAASSDGLWVRDAATLDMEYVSPAVEAIYGVEPQALLYGVEHWTSQIVEEDRAAAVEHLERARAGEPVVHEFRIRRPTDGAIRWIRNTDFPLHDATGRLTRIGGIAEDVTEAKRLADHQQVLLAELQHRVRNILAVVRSVFNRTVEAGGDVEDVTDHFQGRLDNLARTQVVVTGTAGGNVDLENLIRDELLSVGVSDGPVLTIEGPEVLLPPNAAESVGLAIHELTTNALKFGALKVAGAKLNIRWSVNSDYSGESRLDLIWTEQGVPAVPIRPTRQGFGSELITEALPYRLGAETSLEFRGGGVRCTISLPLPSEGAFGGADRESALT